MQSELNFTRFDGEMTMMLIEFSSKKTGSMDFCKMMFYMLIDFASHRDSYKAFLRNVEQRR